jgi:hypothetical protein
LRCLRAPKSDEERREQGFASFLREAPSTSPAASAIDGKKVGVIIEVSMSYAPQQTRSRSASGPTTGPVTVNWEICLKLAEWIKCRDIPLDHEESSLKGFTAEQIGNFFLLLVAISHQTSPQGKPPLEGIVSGRHSRGWDYLFGKFEEAVRTNGTVSTPDYWARLTPEALDAIFRDERFGSRLTDLSGRATLINDLGRAMTKHSWKTAGEIYAAAGGRIATGQPSLVDLLSQFHAYRDPVRKKTYFYLALMRNAGVWKYQDSEELGAPVDYHEVRGHLRIGTVQIQDANLHSKILHRVEVTPEEDISIRQAVHEALMFLSAQSGLQNPSQLHYLFWNVFRSCCTRENPHCYSCPPLCSLPARYVPLALFPDGSRHCPFLEVCTSAGHEPKLVEHTLLTDFY